MMPPIQPDQLLKAIFDSTEPTGRDYFLGKFPATDSVTMQYQSIIQEARHFQHVFNNFRIGPVSSRGELGTELGRVADTAISAAPNILKEEKDKLHDGVRGLLEAAVKETVELVRSIYDYEARYNVQSVWTKALIEARQEEITRAIKTPPTDWTELFPWAGVALGGLAGLVLGALGESRLSDREGRRAGILLFSSAALGAAVGWAGGGSLLDALFGPSVREPQRKNFAEWVAKRTQEYTELKAVKEKMTHLETERVTQRTLNSIRECLEEHDSQLRLLTNGPEDRDRRKWIEDCTRRHLEGLFDHQKNRSNGWGQVKAKLVQATLARDANGCGDAIVGICEFGNKIRRTSESAKVLRVNRLVDGFAKIKLPSPVPDPDSHWY
jgi:hypothetical protein